jgi:hypothetical protein
MMKTRIEERWNALVPAPEKPTFQLLDAEHPMLLYIGKTMSGELLLLIVDGERPPTIKSMRSLDISTSQRPDGRWNLLLTLRQPELSGVFALLCEDLASSSRHLPRGITGMQFLGRRLSAWRRLMEEGRSELLSPSEAKGLMGELVVLERFLLSEMDRLPALKAWVGPLGADQDFQFPDLAWEVKAVAADAKSIQIASERQLHAMERALRLVVVTLTEAAGVDALSLNTQVERLRSLMQNNVDALDLFEDRLKDARYVTRQSYDEPLYKIGRMSVYRVDGDFPRLRPTDLPNGICELSYRVRMEACLPFKIDTPSWN